MRFNQPTYNPLNVKRPGAYDRAANTMAQAGGTYGRMQPGSKTRTTESKTLGGGMMSGLGGAMAGASLAGTMLGTTAKGAAVGGPPGAAIGALIGIGAYLFS